MSVPMGFLFVVVSMIPVLFFINCTLASEEEPQKEENEKEEEVREEVIVGFIKSENSDNPEDESGTETTGTPHFSAVEEYRRTASLHGVRSSRREVEPIVFTNSTHIPDITCDIPRVESRDNMEVQISSQEERDKTYNDQYTDIMDRVKELLKTGKWRWSEDDRNLISESTGIMVSKSDNYMNPRSSILTIHPDHHTFNSHCVMPQGEERQILSRLWEECRERTNDEIEAAYVIEVRRKFSKVLRENEKVSEKKEQSTPEIDYLGVGVFNIDIEE